MFFGRIILKFLLCLYVLVGFFRADLHAQNLVTNPSFEERECLANNENPPFHYERTLNWSHAEFVQFFSSDGYCPNVELLNPGSEGIPEPISGTRFGQLFMGFPATYERISHIRTRNNLLLPLEGGKKYFFKMHRMLAPWSEYTTNYWEVVLFPNITEWGKGTSDIRLHPDAIYTTIIEPDNNFIDTSPEDWEVLESCFEADGGESILSFLFALPGDFDSPLIKINPDYKLTINQPFFSRNAFALFLEDVTIEAVPDEVTLSVEFCDNDRQRRLDKENFIIPEMALMTGTTYLWQDGNKELYRSMAGINFAELTVNMPCASFPVQVTVNEKACQEGVYLPQAFSPNKDGINDIFKPLGVLFEVSKFIIYDRYGGELYKGSGPDAGWDGTSRGYEMQPGVYTWMLEYTTEYNETKVISGEVLLRR